MIIPIRKCPNIAQSESMSYPMPCRQRNLHRPWNQDGTMDGAWIMCRRTIFLTLHSHVSVVSRLVFRKGMDLLVGIIPIVCRHLPFVDFVIGGDGPKMLNLQEMVERERLQDRVEFLGSVPHASVRDALVRGHVFLSCSLTESFCIAILEAASCGLLVVSTNVGGVPEVLPENMILLSEPNLPSMVNVLARAVELQPEWPIDPWCFHERIQKMFSWQRVALETELVYNSIMVSPRITFSERMICYQSIGGLSGYIACFLALTIEFWYRFVEWWQPCHKMDVVPDLDKVQLSVGFTQKNVYKCT